MNWITARPSILQIKNAEKGRAFWPLDFECCRYMLRRLSKSVDPIRETLVRDLAVAALPRRRGCWTSAVGGRLQ